MTHPALKRLSDGNARYLEGQSKVAPGHRAIERAQPFAAVLACSDSRFIPERLFDTDAGELFIVRAAGNTASEAAIASLEFACLKQDIECIVVLGHGDCQAVISACSRVRAEGALGKLIKHVGTSIPVTPEGDTEAERHDAAIRHHARSTATKLTQVSACLKERIGAGKLVIVPAYSALSDGRVIWLEPPL